MPRGGWKYDFECIKTHDFSWCSQTLFASCVQTCPRYEFGDCIRIPEAYLSPDFRRTAYVKESGNLRLVQVKYL